MVSNLRNEIAKCVDARPRPRAVKQDGLAKREITNDMEPGELAKDRKLAFNLANAGEVEEYYAENAVNHQVV